ncbi:septation protein SpoVG family protein [Bacteroides heparinolyticus]|uniref:septation protein SpoVG family protein n=1 Tax=Prevotella heparinolytica TaxID=28113 RepID=UPI00359F3697
MEFKVRGHLAKDKGRNVAGFYEVVFEDSFVVRGFLVVKNYKNKLDVLFPSVPDKREESGWRQLGYPITAEFRAALINEILRTHLENVTLAQQE